MSSHSVFSAGAAALVFSLGCSGGDLTLPAPNGPAEVRIVSGDGQQAEVGKRLEQPLTVQVLDGGSRPVSDTPVQFSFVGDVPGAELDPDSGLTDENGRAATIARLGQIPGEQLIVAQVTSLGTTDLRASFSVTAVPGGKKGGGGDHGGGDE
jgi:hypothetical protein